MLFSTISDKSISNKQDSDKSLFDSKVVVITGGTGSLGRTLTKRLLAQKLGRPQKVIVFSRDEAKQHYMRLEYQNKDNATDEVIYRNFEQLLEFRIGDIRDYHAVCAVLQDADIVINAAALKQVPSCEYFPTEAVKTNIAGAENIVRAIGQLRLKTKTVVGVSTDKACKPVNVMGMSKAIQERIFISANITVPATRFICVRYGNVLASRGSVIPLFHQQIRNGGPVTITTPEMTRFLLPLDRAVDTIFAAIAVACPGETYVPRVPAARIVDVARALIGEKQIKIETVGIRPGEKVHEILVSDEEAWRTFPRGEYYAIKPMLPEIAERKTGWSPETDQDPETGAGLAIDSGPLNREYSSRDSLMDVTATGKMLQEYNLLAPAEERGRRTAAMKVMTVLGTRPEIIRLSRVIPLLDRICRHILVHTGQNFDPRLSDIFFAQLGVRRPDHISACKTKTPMQQIGTILSNCEDIVLKEKPDRLLVLGDTNSALAAVMAKRLGIPVFHMEAGNRCYDDRVPEEVNRRIVDHCSDVLMPYTERSRANLLREGIAGHRIFVTGNPIYEVLEYYKDLTEQSVILNKLAVDVGRYFLVTLHRAENVDDTSRLDKFIRAFHLLHREYQVPLIMSLHPRTRSRLKKYHRLPEGNGVRVLAPLGLFDFVRLEKNALCVLSDSGTVQEECCIFNVPNVTLRDVTERPETVETGSSMLSGCEPDAVLHAVKTVLDQGGGWDLPREYMVKNVSQTVAKIVLGHCSAAETISRLSAYHIP